MTVDFYIEGVPVYQRFMDPSQSNYPAYDMEPVSITIHETENYDEGADAKMHAIYLLNEAYGKQVSWHYTVDNHCIFQHAPHNKSCWHGGDWNGPGNSSSIAIETCENVDGNFQQAVKNVQAHAR